MELQFLFEIDLIIILDHFLGLDGSITSKGIRKPLRIDKAIMLIV